MKKTRHTTEQIIRILRDAEGEQVKTGGGLPEVFHQPRDGDMSVRFG